MQLPSSPQSGANGSNMRSPAQSPHAQRPSQPDMFLKMLEGPVVSVTVGSGCHTAGYNLPVALFCHHSYLFRQTNLRYETATAQIYHNKKRKVFADGEAEASEVKREGGEGDTKAEVLGDMTPGRIGTALIRLPDVDPAIFGLFLKYVYTGYYPAVVDAQSETARSTSHALVSTQHNAPYTPAKAAMPPPANINFRQVPPGGHIPPLPTPDMSTVTLSLNNDCSHPLIPPSVHAYLLAIRLGAPGFLNQALNHIYYGIGKYFTLTPKLVHYIWSNTSPHPFCTASPLRKLVLDVLVVHWSSTTTHIIAKYPTLWNEVFDTHRDLRHEFTTGLQAGTKVPPVQSYFVDTRMPSITGKADDKDSEVEIVEDRPLEVDTSAAVAAAVAAAAAAMEQNNVGGEEKK